MYGGTLSGGMLGGVAKLTALPISGWNGRAANAQSAVRYSADESKTAAKNVKVSRVEETHTPEQIRVMQEYENAVDKNMATFIERVRNGENKKYEYKIGATTERFNSEISRIFGADTTGYIHHVAPDAIVHTENRHGINGKADNSMSDTEDIQRVGYILDNFDAMFKTDKFSRKYKDKNNQFAPVVIVTKKIDGHYVIAEAVPESAKKQIHVISMYKTKAGEVPNDLLKSLGITSENELLTTSDNIISQSYTKSNYHTAAANQRAEFTVIDIDGYPKKGNSIDALPANVPDSMRYEALEKSRVNDITDDLKYVNKNDTINLNGLSVNDNNSLNVPKHKPYEVLGKIKFNNNQEVYKVITEFEKEAIFSDIETACVITTDGTVYKCYGVVDQVFPNVDLGENLTGAIVSHNHPMSKTEHTFSNDDIKLFIQYKLKVLRGCDEKYIYELSWNADNIDETPEDWFSFEQIHYAGTLEKAKDMGLGCRRWINDKR